MNGIQGVSGAAFGNHLESARHLQDQIARPGGLEKPSGPAEAGSSQAAAAAGKVAGTDAPAAFADLVGRFVREVDAKGKVAEAERTKLLSGSGTSIHQTMIAMQESSVAFTMMIEVRNKLVEAYQELMRMQV